MLILAYRPVMWVGVLFIGGALVADAQNPKGPGPKVPPKKAVVDKPEPPVPMPKPPASMPKAKVPMDGKAKAPAKTPGGPGKQLSRQIPSVTGFGGGFFNYFPGNPYAPVPPSAFPWGYVPMSPYGYATNIPYGGSYTQQDASMQGKGGYGPSNPMDANIYQPRKQAENGQKDPGLVLDAFGVPNEGGQIRWPLAFRLMPPSKDHARKQIEAILQLMGRQDMGSGNIGNGRMGSQALATLRDWLHFKGDSMAEATVQEARAFLDKLEAAIR